jgi:hypothetical protein
MPDVYELEDPRQIAAEAPYTYFLPSVAKLQALRTGDIVKIVIRAVPPSEKHDAERMCVIVKSLHPDFLEGVLDNHPFDIPRLSAGDVIRFQRHHIIDIIFREPAPILPTPAPPRREYWDRCLVDQDILDGTSLVHYLYRETPDLAGDHDKHPDSGWRLRGDPGQISVTSAAMRPPAYIALGKVLNKDDSLLHLIDEPEGSSFLRDSKTGGFVRQSPRLQ